MRSIGQLVRLGGIITVVYALLLTVFCVLLAWSPWHWSHAVWHAGQPQLVAEGKVDMWRGVAVHYNGMPYTKSWGLHYAEDGYYYGQKWQCVEFMKRYYHDRLGHFFPDVMGHAAEFFDEHTVPGTLNLKRDLWQYVNGGAVPPQADDILVWTNNVYGHVAIVTRVGEDFVEIIQQNVQAGTRMRLTLSRQDGCYRVGELGNLGEPAGWLSLKK